MNYSKSSDATVLIVDDLHPFLINYLASNGIVCDYFPLISAAEALHLLKGYEGLVIRSKFRLTSQVIAAAHSLKFIARAGAGMDNIDVEAAEERGIFLINAPEGNRDAVGEHTLGLLLTLLAKIIISNNRVKKGLWDRPGGRGTELRGKCVGIIGYGFMGSSFASKLASMGCRVIAYDKYYHGFASGLVEEVQLDELFKACDIVSLHVGLTTETKYMADTEFFERFHKPIFFLNTSRGEIVNTPDLVTALQSGKVLAAGLDVLEKEKFPLNAVSDSWFSSLASMPQVVLTPHVAGWTTESYMRISEVLAAKILEFYSLGPGWDA